MDEKSDIPRPPSDALVKEAEQTQAVRPETPADDAAVATVEELTSDAPERSETADSMPAGFRDPTIPGWRLLILITALCIGLFLSLLDTSIVATALYTIGDDFGNLASVNWVALAYTLSYVGFAVVFASLADVFGRRNTFLAASVIFVAFSLGCGFSQSLEQLIAMRTFQGLGGAGLYAVTMIVFPEVSPMSMTKWIGGVVGAVIAVAGVMGPVLGGIITHYTTWRWIFWINGPIGLLSIVTFWLIWPPADQIRPYSAKPLRQVDFLGSTILIAASVLVVFSFQEGGLGANNWNRPIFLVPIIVGCMFWIALFGWEAVVERRWPESISSIFPLYLLRNRIYTAAMIATLFLGFPFFVAVYTLPIRFQVVHGKSVLSAGLYLLPMLGSSAIASMLGGMISAKKNYTSPSMIFGSSMMLIGVALLSSLPDTLAIPAKNFGFEVFVGFGFGLTVSSGTMLSNLESPLKVHAVSQGIVAQMRVLGGSIGIAASTAILGVNQRKDLAGLVTEAQLASLRSIGPTLSPVQWAAIRKAYSDAFVETMRVCAVVAGLCVLVTAFTYRRKREDIFEIRKRQFKEEHERVWRMNTPAAQVSAAEAV